MITGDKHSGIPGPNGLVLSRCNYLAVSSPPPSSTLSYIAVPAIKLDFHSSRTGKVGGGASDTAASSSRGKRAEAS